jgi:hypothetical protein
VFYLQYEKLVLTKDLEIKKVEFFTQGRKTTLTEVREKMLKKQSKYLRATTDTQYDDMTRYEIIDRLKELNEVTGIGDEDEQMMQKLKSLERTRHLFVWLDNSTVANSGYLVCIVTCL